MFVATSCPRAKTRCEKIDKLYTTRRHLFLSRRVLSCASYFSFTLAALNEQIGNKQLLLLTNGSNTEKYRARNKNISRNIGGYQQKDPFAACSLGCSSRSEVPEIQRYDSIFQRLRDCQAKTVKKKKEKKIRNREIYFLFPDYKKI